MSSVFIKYGVLSGGLAVQTLTPTIESLACVIDGGNTFVVVEVKNNDSNTATVEVSASPTFSSPASLSIAGGATDFINLGGFSNPPGSTTIYARATASGKLVSNSTSLTQNIALCQTI
jgi:hypothetical protein